MRSVTLSSASFKTPTKHDSSDKNSNSSGSIFFNLMKVLALVFSGIWLVSVYKIFVLASPIAAYDAISINQIDDVGKNSNIDTTSTSVIDESSKEDSAKVSINTIKYATTGDKVDEYKNWPFKDHRVPSSSAWLDIWSAPSAAQPGTPKGSFDYAEIIEYTDKHAITTVTNNVRMADSRSSNNGNNYNSNSNSILSQKRMKQPHELKWPPVQPDGSIPLDEGTDTMPLTGIKVPKFWFPAPGEDYNQVGSKVNGQETIFLMIASYRDFQCRETIASAYSRADHPERLYVGAVDQVVDGDIGCLDNEVSCADDPEQPLCKYRSQISVYKMDATIATGPVTARHIGDRMYRGEYFVMQMDAHCQFVRHWDTQIINQFYQTKNEMAVLSSYLTDVQGSINKDGDSNRNSRPLMCNSDYEGIMPARYLRHGSQPEEVAAIRNMPQLQPYWAAGFSFSRGHFKIRVPYDGYQPMVFQGEEIAIGIRGFTYGYDFYAPRDSVVFHEYAERSSRRKKIPMFWEHSEAHKGEGQKSLMRGMSVIKMSLDIDPSSYDHTEEDRYGLGTVRDVNLFYKLFLINRQERKAVQLCPYVRPGTMHADFTKYLRPDGLGIDYRHLQNYNTLSKLN